VRYIDMETWERGELFKFFNAWACPHFSMCANVDLTAFQPVVRQRNLSFTVSITYVIARAANSIPEFRYRIRQGKVVEHEVVHPSTTILTKGGLFGFCTFEYAEDFAEFAPKAAQQMAFVREHPTLESTAGRDDLLYMTAIPWVSFTSFMHPLDLYPADSFPRFACGKYFSEGERLKMPLSIQGHHAVMDGLHVSRCYEAIQGLLDQPAEVLGQD
jgi:chloramphenicol O-acetyltransferase type A